MDHVRSKWIRWELKNGSEWIRCELVDLGVGGILIGVKIFGRNKMKMGHEKGMKKKDAVKGN